jgi:hypothetical protein
MATTTSSARQPKTEQVRSYLLREATPNGGYFKSRFIAQDLDLTPKEIGAVILKLQSDCPELDIEKWSYTNGTTWYVTAADS